MRDQYCWLLLIVGIRGRLWAGTMEDEEKGEPLGSLYMLDTNKTVTRQLDSMLVLCSLW